MEGSEYRPLSIREREVLVWLLNHGTEEATNFLPLLDLLEARSSCTCGCPSLEFSVPVDAPFISSPQGMRLFAEGHTGTDEVGVMLTAGSGVLSDLEVYTYGGVDHAFGLPLLHTLRRSSSNSG